MARRFRVLAAAAFVVVALLAAVAAPAAVSAGARSRAAFCFTSPYEQREYEGYAEYILSAYESVDPAAVGPNSLTREIRREEYFGRLDCMNQKIARALSHEIRYDQPGEDFDAAYQWYEAVVDAQT